MPKKETFDFKHKNPAEIKPAAAKEPAGTDYQINAAAQEKIHEDKKKPVYTENPVVKPKAEPRNKRVQLLLTESNHLKIKEYASSCGTSVNDAINQIIENL